MTATPASALIITQTTSDAALSAALGGGGGLTITSSTVVNGAAQQFGTYTGFSSPPVTLGNGVVLSSGKAGDTTAASHNYYSSPSTNTGASGTAEFNAYGLGHIANFNNSNDVAALQVTFTLASASQVGFSFVFGSVEYPVYVGNYTDAFLAFLDGTGISNQIVFDATNQAVQVGSSFASALTTADTNSAFFNPHGLVKLQTFTVGELAAGTHTITFEVGDVNDHELDSAAFITNLHAGSGQGGTSPVPEPSSLSLFGIGLAGLLASRRHKNKA
jgi:hypothetical protein